MIRTIDDMARGVARALALRPTERWLALEALVALALGRLALAILPFPTAMRRLGLRPGRPTTAASDPGTCAAVAVAVRRASRVAPFRAVCLQQAVAAALLLRRRGQPVEVHFGVTRCGGSLEAHAWTVSAGRTVTGGTRRGAFTPIALFTP